MPLGQKKIKLPFPPPHLSVDIFWIFFLEIQKQLFFLSDQALTLPPLLMAGPLKKVYFCGFPYTFREAHGHVGEMEVGNDLDPVLIRMQF